jgi:hypothetical protein
METITGLIGMLVAAVIVIWLATKNSPIARPLLVGFVLRASLAIVDALIYPLPGAGDGVGWNRVAWYWARNGIEGTFEYMTPGHPLYIWMMSVVYVVFGRSPLLIQSGNVLLGTLMIAAVWRLAGQLSTDATTARRAAWLTAVFPSLVFFSSVLLREVVVSYPLVLSVLFLVRWYRERQARLAVAALAGLLVSMAFHSGGLAVLLFAGVWLIGSWLKALFSGQFAHLGRNTLALIAGLAVVALVLGSGFGQQKFTGLESGDLAVLNERQEGFAHGRTAYLEDLRATSTSDLIWQTPIRLTYFLFAPFPWMMETGSDAFGVLDSLLFVTLVAWAFHNRKAVSSVPLRVLTLGVFGALAVVFALGVSNYGTALRHRNKMLPLLIAATVSIPRRRKQADPRALPAVSNRPTALRLPTSSHATQ